MDVEKLVLKEINCEEKMPLEDKCAFLKGTLPAASEGDIQKIADLTRNQHETELWHTARHGRITASTCHDVKTRMATLQRDPTQSADNLVRRLLYPKPINTPAMMIGRNWEGKALHRYGTMMEEQHEGFLLSKSGFFVSQDIHLGASPDGLVSCKCHQPGLVEIKCAVKHWNKDPKSREVMEALPYLVKSEKSYVMNTNHKYYSQVQFQMGVTGRKWCDFVVFTALCVMDDVPPFVLRVDFDEVAFKRVATACTEFWFQHMIPEMLEGKLKVTVPIQSAMASNKSLIAHLSDHRYDIPTDPSGVPCGSTCPICHLLCKEEENVKKFVDRSICCDQCNTWFHLGCIGMNKKKLQDIERSDWYCNLCAME